MNDDGTEMLRAADPGTVFRGDPLSERAERELIECEAAEPRLAVQHRVPRHRRWTRHPLQLVTGGGVLAMIVIAVIAFAVMRPTAAVAVTPQMLDLTPVSGTASELLKEMETMRRGGEPASQVIRAQTWFLSISFDENDDLEASSVEPQWTETVFEADGAVRLRQVAAEPFPGQESEGLPAPGEVLSDESFAPGEWDTPCGDGPPEDSAEVGSYLVGIAGETDLAAAQTMSEITGMLLSIPVTREQEAALIGHLAMSDGVAVAGATTDRLGRKGVVFSASSGAPGAEREERVIVSPETGRILAAESTYRGTDLPGVASPSVVSYVAWER